MKKTINKFLPLIIFFILTSIFFAYLFFPHLSIYSTPDLGRSDIVNDIYSVRYLFKQIVESQKIPLWTNQIGTGIPFMMSGVFNILDYILLNIFSAALSMNLLYFIFTLISLLSTYGFSRYLKLSQYTSIFVAIVFSFSGVFIFRIQHLSVFISNCLLPLIFLLTLKTIDEFNIKSALLLALVISQQILIGHPQFVFITLLGTIIVALYLILIKKEKIIVKIQRILLLAMAVGFGIALTSVQVIPTIEFKSLSVRSQGLSFNDTTTQSFSPKYFLNIIYPYIFGNPANASYQLFKTGGLDIFWEKAGYFGIIPLIFVFFEIFNKEKKSVYEKSIIILLIISVLLVLGKYSPILFVYLFPPFNFFQIPARFLVLVIFSLSILAGFGLERWHPEKINTSAVKFILIIIVFFSSLFILYQYHPTVLVTDILKPPESSIFLKDKPGRIYQVGGSWPYIEQLQSQGWQDLSYYYYARNSLDPNINLLYGNTQTGVYSGLLTQRESMIQKVLVNEAKGDLNNMTATSTPLHKKILNLTSTRFIISPFQFNDLDFKFLKKISPPNDKNWSPFYIYENIKYLQRIRFVSNYINAKDEDQALEKINSKDFDPENSVVVEGDFKKRKLEKSTGEIKIIKDLNEEIIFNVENNKDEILVMADSYYPGWKATVDGKNTKIYPANINQRAIFVPAGHHQIQFKFVPQLFEIGKKISIALFTIWLVLFILSMKVGRIRPYSKDGNG